MRAAKMTADAFGFKLAAIKPRTKFSTVQLSFAAESWIFNFKPKLFLALLSGKFWAWLSECISLWFGLVFLCLPRCACLLDSCCYVGLFS